MVAEHLPPQSRTAANALLSGFSMAAYVVGPLLAGLAVAAAGPALPVTADAVSFAILAVAAATVRGHPRTAGFAESGQPDRAAGFSAIARSSTLAGLLVPSAACCMRPTLPCQPPCFSRKAPRNCSRRFLRPEAR